MLNSPMLSIFQHFHAIPLRSPLISLRSKWRLTGFSRRFTPKNPVRLHKPFGQLPRWGAKNVLPLNLIALPIGKGDRTAVDRVLSFIVDLRRSFPLVFHTASTLSGSLRSPPSPRGEGFVRPYCFSTYACIRSDNARKAMLSYRSLPHRGRGTASAVDRVLSYIVDLRRISSLFFIPLVPYPARSARHLPHAGKALFVRIVFPHMRVFALTMREKRCSRIVAFPIGEGEPRQRWIGYSRISST